MSFGINKYVTIVIKPINFVQSHSFEDSIFHLSMYSIPKVSYYTYFEIPFIQK